MLLPSRGEQLYTEVWRDMELRLGEAQLDRFFWAQLVRHDARVSRTDVYAAMQRRLDPIAHSEADVEQELHRLNIDSFDYQRIVESCEDTERTIERRLDFLRSWGAETARPLILEILTRVREQRLSPDLGAQCLGIIESFLVRRMLVGIPTNNLNRIFSSLTPTLSRSNFGPLELTDAMAGGAKYWPSDNQLTEALKSRPFYFSGQPTQRRLVLEKIAAEYAGKEPVVASGLTIEHIMPQTPNAQWLSAIDSDAGQAKRLHDQYVHTIGNLTLTSYNSELGAKSYTEKRAVYLESSVTMTRMLAQTHESWSIAAILERSCSPSGRHFTHLARTSGEQHRRRCARARFG